MEVLADALWRVADGGTAEALSMWGALTLQRAIPASVALYEIAVAVELGDAGRALRAAGSVDVAGLSAERRAWMLIIVGRAHAQRRQVADAVAALQQAAEISPRAGALSPAGPAGGRRPARHAEPAERRASRTIRTGSRTISSSLIPEILDSYF